jgi:N-acetylmuramoyl-L-alanine amidase
MNATRMRHLLCLAGAALLLAAVPLEAASARVMYERALEREQAVRVKLQASKPSKATVAEAHRVVAAWERLAARYPRSGYTDNALWQAASLAADLWGDFGADADRAKAVRLYRELIKGYPTSSLLRRARLELRRLDSSATRRASAEDASDEEDAPSKTSATSGSSSEPDSDEHVIPVPAQSAVRSREVAPPPSAHATAATASNRFATLVDIKRSVVGDLVRVILELDREVSYHDQRIGNPDRVFVDLSGAHVGRDLRRTQSFDAGVVRQLRIGEHDDTTRVVLDIDGAARHSLFALYNPYRLVIDCALPGNSAPQAGAAGASLLADARVAAPPTELPAASAEMSDDSRVEAPGKPPAATAKPKSVLPVRQPAAETTEPAPAPEVIAGTPDTTLRGQFSLSRQLGLGISRIVIDPGHGGHDPGAHGKGITEADLVLDVALRLEKLLLAQRGVEVVMTRRTDVFIPLEERTAIANREGADLFLSIHANASRNRKAHGVETYFLNFASNPDAQSVAARENAASGRTMHSLPEIVRAITINDKLDESRDFATMVQRSMIHSLRTKKRDVRDLGVKRAPFVVLIGAVMPSVLAEISFVTNPQEGKLLKSGAYRQKIAEALLDGIATYQRSVKNVRTAANQ